MTQPYPFLPLTPADVREVAARLGEVLQRRFEEITALQQQIADDIRLGRRAEVLATLDEFKAAVAAYQTQTLALAEGFVRNDLPNIYRSGAARDGGQFSWTQAHIAALVSLSSDTYGDFLRRSQEFGRTAERFARQVRSVARRTLPQMAAGNVTAVQAGRDFARGLEEHGIRFVTYADGSTRTAGHYGEMAARTKGAIAYNHGTIVTAAQRGFGWVEVFDGNGCGWTKHDDPEQANGTIRTLEEALAWPISHPNCQRAFGSRPDITNADEARNGQPTPRGLDNEPTSKPVVRQSAADRANARRDTQAARRAERAAPPVEQTTLPIATTPNPATALKDWIAEDHDPQLQQAFATAYDKVLNDALPKQLGLTARSQIGNGAEVNVRLTAGNGDVVGTMVRTFDLDAAGRPTIYNSYFSLRKDIQGEGIGDAFKEATDEFYRANGASKITVHANIDVGGYTWASQGFVWDMEHYGTATGARRDALNMLGRIEENLPKGEPNALTEEYRRRFYDTPPDEWPTPKDLSRIGFDPEEAARVEAENARALAAAKKAGTEADFKPKLYLWPGKKGLLRTSWYGKRML